MEVEIKGTVEEIIFKNEDNGYVVAVVETDDDVIFIKGYIPFISPGEDMVFRGKFKTHPTYGEQLEVENCEVIVPTNEDSIERYLSSGLIKGIGPVTAKRIVDKFGKDSLDIIQYNPEKLSEINGIGDAKAELIAESFIDQRGIKNVMMFLQDHGISVTYAMKIYKAYGNDAINIILENPYRLLDDIHRIGFKRVDEIASTLGVENKSPYRVSSGIKYILSKFISNGSTYARKDELIETTASNLNVETVLVENELTELIVKGYLFFTMIQGDEAIYPDNLYNSERSVFKSLIEIASSPAEVISADVGEEISKFEETEGIYLDEKQREAIVAAAENGVLVITGGPGTGKTTIIKGIIEIFEKRNNSILLAAPTGRAAKRMSEATGRESKTIHRMLEFSYVDDEMSLGFNRNKENPLVADVIIIDEVSMVDIVIMRNLLDAISVGTRLILVGDIDQLPSVGPGNVLKDIIESKIIETITLEEIFRQSDESMIVENAHRINKGVYPILNEKNKDFYFITGRNNFEIIENIKTLCENRLKNYYGYDPLRDIQVLSPMKNGQIGTINLNIVLQGVLNPKEKGKKEKVFGSRLFRVGDKVMQIKNNYEISWIMRDGESGKGVFNGDIGKINEISVEEKKIVVDYDEGKSVIYDFENIDELTLAYAVTIHKSQGNEFPVVIIPIGYGPPPLMNRNILYTGITRARELVVLVGNERYLREMVNNVRSDNRKSGLGYFFRSVYGNFETE